MTDKVRIDTLRADLLDANNETFLARQAEFESNVRSYPRKLPLAITKAEGVWLTDADNKQSPGLPRGRRYSRSGPQPP